MIDFVDVVRVESTRFLDAVRSAPLDGPVPSCPDWDAADLVWHLAEVQSFWASIVEGLLDDPDEVAGLERPDDRDLLDLFADHSSRLVVALSERSPDDRCWTWHDEGTTVGWVRRRQAHEALIHRVDAELAAGRGISTCDPELAADGVDEILRVQIGGVPAWATFTPSGDAVRISATDHPATWGVALGRMTGTSPDTGKTYDLPAASVGRDAVDPSTLITGPAWELDRWLWGRLGPEGLSVTGDRALVDRLRAVAAESTD
jgi:uncharacterized protein (TIGR03083 family)